MKRSLCILLLLCSLLLTQSLPLAALAQEESGLTVSLQDGECYAGSVEAVLYAPGADALTVTLDGKPLSTETVGSFTLSCTATEVDYTNSVFVANGKEIGTVGGNGEFQFPLDGALFDGKELCITFLPSVGAQAVVDPQKVYGSYNIDDLQISDICIKLPSGEALLPSKLRLSYPLPGKAGVREEEQSYSGGMISVGDGWNAATGMGGSTPDKPILFTAVFDLQNSDLTQKAGKTVRTVIDTTLYADGEHLLVASAGDLQKQLRIRFDNTPPALSCPVASNALLTKADGIAVTASDASEYTVSLRIDGKPYRENTPIGSLLSGGKTHTFSAIATDVLGNTAALSFGFRVGNDEVWKRFHADAGAKVDATGTLYQVTPLESGKDGDLFTVEVGEKTELLLHYAGKSDEDLLIKLYAQKSDGSFAELASVQSGEDVCLPITVDASWVKDGKLTVKAEEYVYTSESDTMVWISDTQYYTRFDDLLDKYQADLDYYAQLYGEGKAGFLLHTGDIADEYSPQEQIEAQLRAASDLHAAQDALGLPYGIVDGNHDVGQSLHDASYFSKYFGEARYEATPWFYGSLNNNESHYDLLTLHGYDFVLVWLGYGVEAEPETVAWATDVLQRYSHRNAILLTHAYLDVDADWVLDPSHPDAYTHSRAKEIWEMLVVPNQNVKAVFCGHTPGVSRNLRKVDETRSVWEVLADYQFYEDGSLPKHILNGMSCDGEGFLRLIRFTGSEMEQSTYSPYSGKSDPFGSADHFTVPFVLEPSVRTPLQTTAFEVFAVEQRLAVDGETAVEGEYLLLGDSYTLTPGVPSAPSDTQSYLWVLLPIGILTLALAVFLAVKTAKHKKA